MWLSGDRDKGAGSLITLSRPRGYLGHGRDTVLVDGKVPPGVNEAVPRTNKGRIRFEPGPLRPLHVVLNKESIHCLIIRLIPARSLSPSFTIDAYLQREKASVLKP